MKAFITKHALTSGIEEAEVEYSTVTPTMVTWTIGGYSNYAHGEGGDWHRTKVAALDRAEQMRKLKIKSLRKSIAKLEALKFRS